MGKEYTADKFIKNGGTGENVLLDNGDSTPRAVAADHGTAATDQIVNVSYGTGSPPTASTTTEGSLFIKYTA